MYKIRCPARVFAVYTTLSTLNAQGTWTVMLASLFYHQVILTLQIRSGHRTTNKQINKKIKVVIAMVTQPVLFLLQKCTCTPTF